MNLLLISFFLLASVSFVNCEHFILGDPNKKELIFHTVAQYNAFPFIKRTKDVFYSNIDQKIIDSILVYDNLQTKATAKVTAGGVGYAYVNLYLESERGEGLEYDIGIYTSPARLTE